jgi:polycomb protein EED
VYQCNNDGSITLLQAYSDADPDEVFYTCAWTFDQETGESLLAIAGLKGIIRIIGSSTITCRASFSGHGNAINELKIHPNNPELLLSASKDHALRFWNLKTSVCVAIFGGVEGHRDEVLSADINPLGTLILSCGMDHSLKVWDMESPELKNVVQESYKYQRGIKKSFPTALINFPLFSTRDIHRNYIDCVRWCGRMALSKSCENSIVLWKPPLNRDPQQATPTVLHRFEVTNCDIWYIRFCLDRHCDTLVLGNQVGKIYIWDMTGEDPSRGKPHLLAHNKCTAAIRQVTVSRDGSMLLSVTDAGTVWRWDRRDSKK